MTFVARMAGDPAHAILALQSEIHAVDPAQAIYHAATARDLSRSLAERRFMLSLLGAFALLAGLLAAIGIYGVISVATTQRPESSAFVSRSARRAARFWGWYCGPAPR
jgi:hypothetical protein